MKSYIYVDDCVNGMISLHGKEDGLFNLGTRGRTTVAQIAEMTISRFAPGAKISSPRRTRRSGMDRGRKIRGT